MALPVYIKMKSEKQGKIKSGYKRKGCEDMIEATWVSLEIKIPTDALTGKASGNRVHGAIHFRKATDSATPQLYAALVSAETITEMKMHFWQVDAKGVEKEFFTVTINDAQVSTVAAELPDIYDHPQLKPGEKIAIRYSKIEWVIVEGNIMAADSWYEPVR
jgi:type VI secretion system secreted protein Hcp